MAICLMVAEDEIIPSDTFRTVFAKSKQFEVHIATLPQNARKMIQNYRLDGCIIDLFFQKLGKYEGLNLIREVRHKFPFCYIQVVTGHEKMETRALQEGADKVIRKPMLPDSFVHEPQRIGYGVARKRLDKLLIERNLLDKNYVFPTHIVGSRWGDAVLAIDELNTNLGIMSDNLDSGQLDAIADILIENLLDRIKLPPAKVKETEREASMVLENTLIFNEISDVDRQRHTGEYVAIVNGRIIGFHSDFYILLRQVKEQKLSGDIFIEIIDKIER